MAIVSTKLTSTAANIIAGSATESKAITCIYLCNVTGSTVTANVFLVQNGKTVSDCLIYSNLNITSTDSVIADTERIILGNGDSIWANCSVLNGVVMTVSSVGV